MAGQTEQIRRVILIGKTGNGKSSTGNSILGEDVFKMGKGFESETQECQSVRCNASREYTIVDTPGLFDTDQPFAKRALEIQRALAICPEPHAFLIVLMSGTRFTEEELLAIDMLRVIFGEEFLKHAIVVFSRGADFKSDQELNDAILKNDALLKLKNECGGRIARVENSPLVDSNVREELVRNVLYMIEQVSDGGNKSYFYKSLEVHRICLEQHLENTKSNAKLGDELTELVEEISHKLEELEKKKNSLEELEKKKKNSLEELEKKTTSWRPYLIGAAAGAGGATIAGVTYAASVGTAAAAAATGDVAAFGSLGAAASYASEAISQASPYMYSAMGAGVTLLGKLAVRFNPFR